MNKRITIYAILIIALISLVLYFLDRNDDQAEFRIAIGQYIDHPGLNAVVLKDSQSKCKSLVT